MGLPPVHSFSKPAEQLSGGPPPCMAQCAGLSVADIDSNDAIWLHGSAAGAAAEGKVMGYEGEATMRRPHGPPCAAPVARVLHGMGPLALPQQRVCPRILCPVPLTRHHTRT